MKKRSILIIIPLMLGLAACGNDSSNQDQSPSDIPEVPVDNIPNKEVVNKLKSLLSKQDLSEFYVKSVKGTYTQEYDVLDILKDNESKTSSYFNYSGAGMFGYYYDLTPDQYNAAVDENGNIDIFDAIAEGKGYYGLIQTSRTMSFEREGNAESKTYNLDVNQNMTLKTTDEDVWVDNTLYVTNDGVFHYDTHQRLTASINKELLFSSISSRTFREYFSKVDLFDAAGNIEHLDKYYISACRELVSKSDKEISNFILANQVSFEDDEENIKLKLTFNTEDIAEEEMDFIFPGEVKGTLFFDKESQKFTNFSYEMAYKFETYDEDSGSIKLINTKFTYSGESSRSLPHDNWEPIDPTIYDDVVEFLKDLNEQLVPPTMIL